MRADLRGFVDHPCLFGRISQNDPNSPTIKGLATPRCEHWGTLFSTFLQFIQHFPDFRRQSDRPRTSVFPEYGDLAGIAPCTEVAPAQPTGLRNAQAGRVEELE